VTSAKAPVSEPAERITLDDLKHRAEVVKDLAVTDTKSAVAAVLDTNETKTLLIVAGVVIAVASIAFFLGTRSVRLPADDF
jgi:hypothetical protein